MVRVSLARLPGCQKTKKEASKGFPTAGSGLVARDPGGLVDFRACSLSAPAQLLLLSLVPGIRWRCCHPDSSAAGTEPLSHVHYSPARFSFLISILFIFFSTFP